MDTFEALTQTHSLIAAASDSSTWLFSACAQTAGAIVAIVGGFLVSSLISIESRFDGLRNQILGVLARIQNAVTNRQQTEASVEGLRLRMQLTKRLYTLLGTYVGQDVAVTVAEFRSLPPGDSKIQAEDIVRQFHDALTVLGEENLDGYYFAGKFEFESFLAITPMGVPTDSYLIWKAAFYHTLCNPHVETLVKEQYMEHLESSVEWSKMMEDSDRLGQLGAQGEFTLVELDGNLRALQTEVAGIGVPRGTATAFVLLVFLSIGGILLPLSLLPFDAGNWNGFDWKRVVLVVFGLGLGAIFTWLLLKSMTLSRKIQHMARDLRDRERVEIVWKELGEDWVGHD